MNFSIIFYVLAIDFLAILSPGPDFFMVLKNSITITRKAGIYTTLGIATGSTFVFAAAFLGVGVVITSSHWVFTIVKLTGAAYLTFVGIRSIFYKGKISEPQLVYNQYDKLHLFSYYKLGLICNLTNPKAWLFIVSIAAYALQYKVGLVDIITIVLGSGAITIMWFSVVSFIFGNFLVRKMFYQRQRIINIVFGLILLYVALQIMTM